MSYSRHEILFYTNFYKTSTSSISNRLTVYNLVGDVINCLLLPLLLYSVNSTSTEGLHDTNQFLLNKLSIVLSYYKFLVQLIMMKIQGPKLIT